MENFKAQDVEGHTFEVCEGVLSLRENDGSLGFYSPVEMIAEIRYGYGGRLSALGLGFKKEDGQFDPAGDSWLVYDFDDEMTAKALAERIVNEKKVRGT